MPLRLPVQPSDVARLRTLSSLRHSKFFRIFMKSQRNPNGLTTSESGRCADAESQCGLVCHQPQNFSRKSSLVRSINEWMSVSQKRIRLVPTSREVSVKLRLPAGIQFRLFSIFTRPSDYFLFFGFARFASGLCNQTFRSRRTVICSVERFFGTSGVISAPTEPL